MAKATTFVRAKGLALVVAGLGATALGGCSSTDGGDRFSVPAPAYPIARTGDGQDFARTDEPGPAPTPQPYSPPRSTGPQYVPPLSGPTPYRPEPIRADQQTDPAEDTGPTGLRGRQSPGPSMPVRSAPTPALETPTQVVVRPGESVFEVAERVRTPIRAIIDLNNLQPPYDVTPGSVLRIPPPVVYTVRPGDTMIGIGRRFSIDPRSLANLNDIQLETALRPGQRLALPSLVKDKGPTLAATSTQVTAQSLPVAGVSVRPVAATAGIVRPVLAKPTAVASSSSASASIKAPSKPAPSSDNDSDTAPSTSEVAAVGKGKFVWPVKGDILSSYGPKGPGQRNDGINIATSTGDPVKAAAAGQVVYAGNSVPGFGNLVVIKHEGGWTSLYGNLGKMSVKIRAEVAQGQEIGTAGTSGAVDRPQVHFELRYAASTAEKAKPLDPASLLP